MENNSEKRKTYARWAETAVVALLAVYTFSCGLVGLQVYGNMGIGGGVCAVAVLYALAIGAQRLPRALCLPLAALLFAYVLVAQILATGTQYLGDTIGLLLMLAETTARSYVVLAKKRYFYTSLIGGKLGSLRAKAWLNVAEALAMLALAIYAIGCGVLGTYVYTLNTAIGNGVTLAALLYVLALAVPLRHARMLLLPACALISAYVLIAQIQYQFEEGRCIPFDTLGLLLMLAESTARSYVVLAKKRFFYTSLLAARQPATL